MKKKFTKKQKQTIAFFRMITITFFIFILCLCFLIGTMFFFRPSVSEFEKRELTKFPKITLKSLWDGSYFSDISLWYSDTFPMRESLIAMNTQLKSHYGIASEEKFIGRTEKGDEIPSKKDDKDKTVHKKHKKGKKPTSTMMAQEVQNQVFEGLYYENGAVYGGYYFNQEAADLYVDGVNKAAKKLKDKTNVYSILVPNNSGAVLDEDTLEKLGGSDQIGAIQYYYDEFENVKGIDTIKTLREHRDEYLYFKTDHHWNTKGAYYVYKNFCKEKGWKPHKLSDFEKLTFEPFYGTYTNKFPELMESPDYVDAYIPMSTNEMQFMDEAGNIIDYQIITDVSEWNDSSGYYSFIGGDKPYSIIDNPEINDGSSCVIVKESYGNCFIPFLVDHYDKIYILDFRYTPYNAVDFCKEHKVTDLILMNNIQLIANPAVAEKYYYDLL